MLKHHNVTYHPHAVTKQMHGQQKYQHPCTLWFTGLSGSGKSSIANTVESRLFELGKHSYLLDGDNVRHGLNKDLSFSTSDRIENIRRIGEVAKLFMDAGLIVLTAFISPFAKERQMVRELMAAGEFIEIFINTPLAICEQRDPKGLYQKARAGIIANFTGIDSPYEAPVTPELVIDNQQLSIDEAAELVIQYLLRRQII